MAKAHALEDVKALLTLNVEDLVKQAMQEAETHLIFQEEITRVENILSQLHGNNKDKRKIQEWYDYLKNEFEWCQLDHNERLQNYSTTVKKFNNNFYSCVQNYIFSTSHSDENLKESYIKLFLWEKLQYVIKFTQWNEYQFSLGKLTQWVVKNSWTNIFDVLVKRYERKFSEPKYKQPVLNFDE